MNNVQQLKPNGINEKTLTKSEYVKLENIKNNVKPIENAQLFLESDDGKFSIGVWECSPCCEDMFNYPCDEYCLVLEGHLEITVDGITQSFNQGDSFTIKKGTNMTWDMKTQFKKYFALYRS